MQKRPTLASPWPRVIAVASGVFGAAVTVETGTRLVMANSVQTLPALIASICGCLFLLLAFPLYAGREWARRTLILTTYCAIADLAVFIPPSAFHQFPVSVYSVPRLLIGACGVVEFLTPAAFFVVVLHHVDVRRAFQTNNASNQSLEPTAGPSDA